MLYILLQIFIFVIFSHTSLSQRRERCFIQNVRSLRFTATTSALQCQAKEKQLISFSIGFKVQNLVIFHCDLGMSPFVNQTQTYPSSSSSFASSTAVSIVSPSISSTSSFSTASSSAASSTSSTTTVQVRKAKFNIDDLFLAVHSLGVKSFVLVRRIILTL